MSNSVMRYLCSLDQLEENKPLGVSLGVRQDVQEVFLIRRDAQIYAYSNHCPHTGASLNWLPDQYLDLDGKYIQCSIHGALFRVDDGVCIWGPCVNQALAPVVIQIENGQVFLPK